MSIASHSDFRRSVDIPGLPLFLESAAGLLYVQFS